MRTLIYILCLLPLQLNAASSLLIEIMLPDEVIVLVDGQVYKGKQTVFVDYLVAGQHSITVLRHGNMRVNKGRIDVLCDQVVTLPDGLQVTYRLKNGALELIRSQAVTANYSPTTVGNVVSNQSLYLMDAPTFDQFLQQVKKQTYDDRKVSFASAYLKDSWISSAQACSIVEACTYDATKLELAKTLYHRVIDPGSYFLVNKAFSYNTNSQKLQQYISSQ